MNPLVSVIVASYNYENFIGETLDSIINQTYQNIEIIVVDDGSSDNSVEVIEEFVKKDSRVKLFMHEGGVNKGLKETILLGLTKASGEWIAFLESDDIFLPNAIEEKVKAAKPDSIVVFSDVEMFGDEAPMNALAPYFENRAKVLSRGKIFFKDLIDINLIPTFSCVMVKKDALLECDFNSLDPKCLDKYLWTQVLKCGKAVYVKKNLTRWRMHGGSYINAKGNSGYVVLTRALLEILNPEKNLKNSLLLALYDFINLHAVEKLFRPQVRALNEIIFNTYLGKKEIFIENL